MAVVLGVESKQTRASYTQLTQPQRYTLEALLTQPITQKDIATQMGVSAATISRERRRNGPTLPYQAQQAHQQAQQRQQRTAYKLKGELLTTVKEHLRERF